LGADSGQTAGLMSPARHASDAQLDAATWCRHLVPDGSVYAFLADHRHELFRLSCSPMSSGRAAATHRCPPR
jgi:hypothetical protein